MRGIVTGISLFAGFTLLVTGCAADDPSINGRQDPAAAGRAEVPGAATPAPNAHSGGWW
ncbi:MAG: hypothetical protein H0X40_16425 [Chthoniobacterales bacterium]|nr:hypothetical protein [Chthoniobacterales bacterium]